MPKSEPKSLEKLSYEAAFAELETIVAALESGERPLEESMTLFARGQALWNGVFSNGGRHRIWPPARRNAPGCPRRGSGGSKFRVPGSWFRVAEGFRTRTGI
jgi:hypothetical protein